MNRCIVELQESFSNAMHNPSIALQEGRQWLAKVIADKEAEAVAWREARKRQEDTLYCYKSFLEEYESYKRKPVRTGDFSEYVQWKKVRATYQERGVDVYYSQFGSWNDENDLYNSLKRKVAALAQDAQTQAFALDKCEFELRRLRNDQQDLQRHRYSEKKEWGFVEIYQEVSRVYRQLIGIHSSLRKELRELALALGVPGAQETDSIGRVLILNALLLRACSLTLDLEALYAIRQELWPALLIEMRTWEKSRISVEFQKYARDLNDLVPDELLLPHAEADALITLPPRELAMHWPLYVVFSEQRRFLEDVKFELEELLAAPNTNNAADQRKRLIAELAGLQQEMRDQISQNPEMEMDIKNLYNQLLDELREKS